MPEIVLKWLQEGLNQPWFFVAETDLFSFQCISILRFKPAHVQTVEIRFKRPNMAGNGCSIIIFENALEWMIFFEVKTFSFCVFLLI